MIFFAPPVSSGPPQAVVREFAQAYSHRRRDGDDSRADPAIDTAFGIAAKSLIHRPAKVSEDEWLKPYASAVGEGEYGGQVDPFPDARFVFVSMGGHKRMSIFGPDSRHYELPAHLQNPVGWDLDPRRLGPGRYLLLEWSTFAEGMNCPRVLEWVQLSGHRAAVVGRFRGIVNLDEPEPKIRGDEVSMRYEPDTKVLAVSGGGIYLESERVWRWRGGGPVLVSDHCRYPGRKAVDDAVAHAWVSKHPTKLQSKIRRLMAPSKFEDDSLFDVDDWKESGLSLTLNWDVDFRLRWTRRGVEVVGVFSRPRRYNSSSTRT